MGVVTSTAQQRRTAEAARRVGGYDQLARLAEEKRATKGSKLAFDASTKRWSYIRTT